MNDLVIDDHGKKAMEQFHDYAKKYSKAIIHKDKLVLDPSKITTHVPLTGHQLL